MTATSATKGTTGGTGASGTSGAASTATWWTVFPARPVCLLSSETRAIMAERIAGTTAMAEMAEVRLAA